MFLYKVHIYTVFYLKKSLFDYFIISLFLVINLIFFSLSFYLVEPKIQWTLFGFKYVLFIPLKSSCKSNIYFFLRF